MGNYYLVGTEFQFGKMEKVLFIDGGDGCTRWMYLMPMNCVLKMAKKVNFVIYINHNKVKFKKECSEMLKK